MRLPWVQAALRANFGVEKVQNEVSGYYIANEVRATLPGMAIAIEAEEWEAYQTMSPAAFGRELLRWGSHARLSNGSPRSAQGTHGATSSRACRRSRSSSTIATRRASARRPRCAPTSTRCSRSSASRRLPSCTPSRLCPPPTPSRPATPSNTRSAPKCESSPRHYWGMCAFSASIFFKVGSIAGEPPTRPRRRSGDASRLRPLPSFASRARYAG